MKKIISLLLALMMVFSFVGCSEEQQPEPEQKEENTVIVESLNKTITVVVYDRDNDAEYWNGIKKAFESANSGVTVNLVLTKDAGYEVRERILGGNSPDVVFLPADEESGVTEALIKDRAMLALTDVELSAPAGAFDNNVCRPYDDGVSYIAPIFFEEKGLIYNIETLSSAGFSVPATWDEFIKIAEDCKNKKYEFFTYAGAEPEEFVDIFAAALVSKIGTEEMNKIFGCDEGAWENESIVTFVEKIEKITKLVVSGSSTKYKDDVLECLKDGKALFISGTAKDLEELNKDGEKYAMCAYPGLSAAQTNIVTFAEMYVPVEAKEPELAKEFIKCVYSGSNVSSAYPTAVFAPEFASKNAANETLADEFCELVVEVFKGKVTSENFAEKMLEYIKEY